MPWWLLLEDVLIEEVIPVQTLSISSPLLSSPLLLSLSLSLTPRLHAGLCDVSDVERLIKNFNLIYNLALPPRLVTTCLDKHETSSGGVDVNAFLADLTLVTH